MTRRVAAGALAGLAAAGALVVAAPGPSYAVDPDGDDCVQLNQADIVEKTPPTVPSAPLAALDIAEAHAIVRQRVGDVEPGTGVRVAVIDNGVSNPRVPVYGGQRVAPYTVNPEAIFYHGTAMAGVIAGDAQDDGVGPVGIAPGAEIYDVRVYDSNVSDDDTEPPTELGIIAGLDAVAPLAGTGPDDIRIVNVSLSVDRPSDALEAAVRRVTRTGAVVVASSGNRVPETESTTGQDDDTGYEFGEDVTKYPAGFAATDPLVLSVGTTTDAEFEDPRQPAGLLSSTVDVVVPTFGAVSYSVNDSTCRFYASSTSVAAAEVSGVLALLAAVHPDETGQQLIARLETTATGGRPPSAGAVDTYRGRGVVQPVEALTRPLRPSPDGADAEPAGPTRAEPAPLPQEAPDVLAGTRRDAVWWGLFGGGALVVALLLRPVLSRRRA